MPMAALDAIARAPSAFTRAPVRPAIAITTDSANASASASWPISPVTSLSSCAAFFPAAGALQGVSHFRRHIFLVVLGQNFAGIECASIVERAERDDALAF